MNLLFKKNTILYIILVAFIFRFFAVLPTYKYTERIWLNDTPSYVTLAKNLLNGNGFSACQSPPYYPDLFRTPIYPLFISGCLMLYSHNLFGVVFFQIIIDILTCLLIYKIVHGLGNKKTACISSFIYAISIVPIEMCSHATSETIFTFLLTLCIFFFLKSFNSNNIKSIILGISFWAIATLCRPIAFLLLIPIFIFILNQNTIKKSLTLILPGLLIISIWVYRNWEKSGLITLSSVSAYNIYLYNANSLIAHGLNKPENETRDNLKTKINEEIGADPHDCSNAFQGIVLYKEKGLKIIRDNLSTYIYLHIKSCIRNFIPPVNGILEIWGVTSGDKNTIAILSQKGWKAAFDHYFENKKKYIILFSSWILIHFLLIAGWVIGLVLLLINKQGHLFLLLGGISITLLLIPGPASEPRFAQPVFPIFIIVGTFTINEIAKRINKIEVGRQ